MSTSAWRKAMEAAEVRWQALRQKALRQKELHGLTASDVPLTHYFRPLRENLRTLDRAAKAAGVPACQVIIVPEAKILYDPEVEVPIRLRIVPQLPVYHVKAWRGNLIHSDTTKYDAYRVLKDVYELVRQEDDPPAFEQCTSGAAVLATFQKLGSLATLCCGTCLATSSEGSFVVVDAAYRFKCITDAVLSCAAIATRYADELVVDSIPMAVRYRVSDTCCSVVTIPAAAFRAGEGKGYSFTPGRKPDMDELEKYGFLETAAPDFLEWLEMEKEGAQGDVVVAPEFGGIAKVAVEIDRRILGEPNIILFELPEVADDPGLVMQRLRALKLHPARSSLGLALRQVGVVRPTGPTPRVYALVPRWLDAEHLPFQWIAEPFGIPLLSERPPFLH